MCLKLIIFFLFCSYFYLFTTFLSFMSTVTFALTYVLLEDKISIDFALLLLIILPSELKIRDENNCLVIQYIFTLTCQDLLMNLSSNNTNQSNHPTPVSQEPPSDPSSISFEQYRSPLVNSYYTPNYASLRSNSAAEETEPPAVPPLPPSPLTPSPITVEQSPLHYRSLQNTPAVNSKTKTINSSNYFPRMATDPPNRKRYHTAPRDKQRVRYIDIFYKSTTCFCYDDTRIRKATKCRWKQ